jgi:signal transduction histidine kinase
MTANQKLSTVFSIMAAMLLLAVVTAIWLIGRSEPLLKNTLSLNQKLVHVTQALQSLREHPQEVAQNEAWLNDLAKLWQDSPAEKRLLEEARGLLLQDRNAVRAAAKLDQLQREYQAAAADSAEKLAALRDVAVITTVAVIASSVVLVVLLMFLTRVWLVYPLRDLRTVCLDAAAGHPNSTASAALPPEFADVDKAVQQMHADLRVARERAEHAGRLATVGEACTHVTNSLRQALHSVATVAQYEGEAERVDPNAKAAFQYIVATINKLEARVRNLHLVVAPNNAQTAPQQVELILHDVVSLLQPDLRDHAVEVTLEPADSLPEVRIDRPRVEQALLAVLTNAIEASPPGGRVTVRTRNESDRAVTIQIEDQGPGMSQTTRERAFSPFFTTKRENVGLGLSMAYKVVTQHGGKITLEAVPSGGTRVSIELPAAYPTDAITLGLSVAT